MTTSTLGDGDILKGTVQKPANGGVDLEFTLSSGKVISYGQPIEPDKLKGRLLIQWVNFVREQDALDRSEREERDRLKGTARRQQDEPSSAPSEDPAGASTKRTSSSESGLPDDPTSLLTEKVQSLSDQLILATQEKEALDQRISRLQENLEKWTGLARGLGIPLSGPTPPTETPVKKKKRAKRGPRSKKTPKEGTTNEAS